MLKQAKNRVHIEGILAEKEVTVKDDSIRLNLVIKIEEGYEVPVTMYSKKLKNDGTENGFYKSIETVSNEYVSLADVKEGVEADKVRITSGQLSHNIFKRQDGKLVKDITIRTNFINRIKETDKTPYQPRAEFTIQGIVESIKDVMNEDGDVIEKKVDLLVPVYGGNLHYMSFSMCIPEGMSYLEDNASKGTYMELDGIINFKNEKVEKVIKRSFGADKIETTFINIKKFNINGADLVSEDFWDEEEVEKATKELQNYIRKVEEEEKGTKNTVGNGFGIKGNTTTTSSSKQADEIPF